MAALPKLHPRILDVRTATMITRERVLEPGLIVRTDVVLHRSDPGFDEKEFEDFLDAVGEYHDKYGMENILIERIEARVS
ncbi:hypothetical protein [Methylosinus sp. KRF6]|uniref:hypothetical protein n=1 Tax=Methylosinus sp. KRF6 TaxID=2846853 RepID=UPI001C0E387C|nr:hypothetical protein [Methylosinus sp. KRF6]MBU3889797.1 hypothetical protein [Methylosinus sp. KRF6]